MKLLGSAKKDVDKDKHESDVPKLEFVEVDLVHCNLVNSSYQGASKVLFSFVPNKQIGELITISLHSLTMLKTTSAEFQSIELWFTDHNNRPLEIEDSANITQILGRYYKNEILNRTEIERSGYLSFARKFGDKYGKKLMDIATNSGTDAAKTAS